MNGTVNVNNYILTILSFAFSSLFTFTYYFIIISFFTLDFFRYARAYRAYRQLRPWEGKLTTDPKQIMMSQKHFILTFMMVVHVHTRGHFPHFLSDPSKIPSLLEEKKNVCEGKLGHGECYNALQTFQKNKSPGNDSLTVEFQLVFGLCLDVCWLKF